MAPRNPLRADPTAAPDEAAVDTLPEDARAPSSADPGPVPLAPADGAYVPVLAVVVRGQAGLEALAHISG
eukprot:2986926-Alexandrium_andersonii.AAC.1